MRRIVLSALLLLAVLGAAPGLHAAASLSERSPVRLGLWWDPEHTGSGFEFFRAGDQIALVWYTYRDDGMPAWYLAAGQFDAAGRWEAPLFKHRWAQGAAAPATEVGKLTLQRDNPESVSLAWRLHGREGVQQLTPFPISGVVPEVDHSGAWYDPTRSGFGLSLTEQGQHLAAGLYFYDAAGEPTWRLAENGGSGGELAVTGTTGACPGCTARSVQTLDERGSLGLVFESETGLRADYRGAATAAWPLSGRFVQLSRPASQRPADRQLARFDDAPALRRYLDEALLRGAGQEGPAIDFSPAPATTTFSSTNLQEAGVDEADRLKSDGRFLYTFGLDPASGAPNQIRIAQFDALGRDLRLHASLPLVTATSPTSYGYRGLHLTPSRLVAMSGTAPQAQGGFAIWGRPTLWTGGSLSVSIYDRASPATPQLLRTLEFDAHLVSSRRIGDRLHLVLRKSIPLPAGFESGGGADPARDQRNRARIAQVPLADMLPRMRAANGEWSSLVSPQDVHLSIDGTVPGSPEFVAVASIDLASPESVHAIAVAGATAAVYVAPTRMYLATSRRGWRFDPVLGTQYDEPFALTDIHQIALDEAVPRFVASAAVEGYLDRDADRAPFRFSERDGKLRVVTVGGDWGRLGANRLTVLEPSVVSPGLLRTVSFLPNRDRPAPLGKPGELLYGTRFVGARLYAVTFLSIDPLYVVDLSDPAAPKIAGEVELPGFSDYLHPVGDSLLLGFGLDARPAQNLGDAQFAWYQGLMYALFDVSDPNRPRVLQQRLLGKRGSRSAILATHHALSVLPATGATRFAVPVRVHESDGSEPRPVDDSYTYPWSWSGLQTLQVTGTDVATARLDLGPALPTHKRGGGASAHFPDDATEGARSVQFSQSLIYVENGRFWRMDSDGSNISGPL